MGVTTVNLVLTIIILALGIWAYIRQRSIGALLVGIAFGLFAVSHLLTLLGLATTFTNLLIAIRILGYLTALVAVFRIGMGR
jgi:uncharacterized membrane protein (UPF0136 family)